MQGTKTKKKSAAALLATVRKEMAQPREARSVKRIISSRLKANKKPRNSQDRAA